MKRSVWLYRCLLKLLPSSVYDRDGEEMAQVLDAQIADAPDSRTVAWRALRRLPSVIALEWRDVLLTRRYPAPQPQPRTNFMESISRMFRQSFRSLLRTPAFTHSVVLLLGLGVGSVSAIFAVVDNVLLRRLPYPSAERLFLVERGSHSMTTFKELQALSSADAWTAASSSEESLTGQGDPQRVRVGTVTNEFFAMFGGTAQLGRLLQLTDYEKPEAVVLSYGTWMRLFGADTTVIGKSVQLNNHRVTVVGVLNRDFAVPEAMMDASVDFWQATDPSADYMTNRDYYDFAVVGRLRVGASLKQAALETERLAQDRAKAYPDKYIDNGKISTLPVNTLQESTTGDFKDGLTMLFAAVSVLLLVACANVTHLFLARGVTRVREIAVRRALGAGTGSLVMQMLSESALLGMAGSLVGIALAYVGVRAFLVLMPEGLPRAANISIDLRIMLFAAGTGTLTAVLFGLLPAMRFTRTSLSDPIRNSSRNATGGRTAQSFRFAIVVFEVALSLVLVAQSGWLLRSFVRMTNEELGYRTEGVLTAPLVMPGIEGAPEWLARSNAILESVRQVPGVKQAAFGLNMPLEWVGGSKCCWMGRPEFRGVESKGTLSTYMPVSTDYFDLLQIKLVAGKSWTESGATANPVPVVINEMLAQKIFGSNAAALGAQFTASKKNFEVIGVVANNRHYGADQPYFNSLYLPVSAMPFAPGRVAMAIRTDRTDAAIQSDIRAAIWRVEKNLPIPTIRSLGDWSRTDAAKRRFDSLFFATFSAIALLLVALGLAGTLLYMVSLQRRNIGIRLALGATPRGLERGVMSRGVAMAAVGAVIGTGGAWLAGRFIESRLYGVQARDVGTLGLSVAVLMLIAVLSSWVPARRAAATSPMECMRAE